MAQEIPRMQTNIAEGMCEEWYLCAVLSGQSFCASASNSAKKKNLG